MQNDTQSNFLRYTAYSLLPTALVFVLFLTLAISAVAQSGATFYVSTTGSDTNNGSFGSPWRTIRHAADSIAAGATVDIRGGTYNESVNIPVSGNSSAGYIVFQSYP
jgi:hypothetical protein